MWTDKTRDYLKSSLIPPPDHSNNINSNINNLYIAVCEKSPRGRTLISFFLNQNKIIMITFIYCFTD